MLWLGDTCTCDARLLRSEGDGRAVQATARLRNRSRASSPRRRTSHLGRPRLRPERCERGLPLKAETLRLFTLYWANASFGLPELPGIFGVAPVRRPSTSCCSTTVTTAPTRTSPRARARGCSVSRSSPGSRTRCSARAAASSSSPAAASSGTPRRATRPLPVPDEQRRLADFPARRRIDGLIFLSGDGHFGELLRVERPAPTRSTSSRRARSPRARGRSPTPAERGNPQVVPGTLIGRRQFGLIRVTGPGPTAASRSRATTAQARCLWRTSFASPNCASRARRCRRHDPARDATGRAGLVPARPARLRPAPLAQALAAGPPSTRRSSSTATFSDALPSPADRRVEFIWDSRARARRRAAPRGGGLIVRHARAVEECRGWPARSRRRVYANHDYEPAARDRDAAVAHALAARGIPFRTCRPGVFERAEVMTQAGRRSRVHAVPERVAQGARAHRTSRRTTSTRMPRRSPAAAARMRLPALAAMGFERTNLAALGIVAGMPGAAARFADFRERIAAYKASRDFPAVRAPPTCRSTCASARSRCASSSRTPTRARCAPAARVRPPGCPSSSGASSTRRFSGTPAGRGEGVQAEYEALAFPNDGVRFTAWCEGRTGYPIVDAAMRQLNATGYMHNRCA